MRNRLTFHYLIFYHTFKKYIYLILGLFVNIILLLYYYHHYYSIVSFVLFTLLWLNYCFNNF